MKLLVCVISRLAQFLIGKKWSLKCGVQVFQDVTLILILLHHFTKFNNTSLSIMIHASIKQLLSCAVLNNIWIDDDVKRALFKVFLYSTLNISGENTARQK